MQIDNINTLLKDKRNELVAGIILGIQKNGQVVAHVSDNLKDIDRYNVKELMEDLIELRDSETDL